MAQASALIWDMWVFICFVFYPEVCFFDEQLIKKMSVVITVMHVFIYCEYKCLIDSFPDDLTIFD